MGRKKRWEELSLINGFGRVKILKWRYFIDYVHQEMLDYKDYIWRGQRCANWPLESTLDRLIKKAKVARTKRYGFRQSHLEKFKYAVRGRRGLNPIPIEDENEWWALGQHHSLATPLLDWTVSPFVAAYFAFIGTGDNQTRYRVVYALSQPSVKNKSNEIELELEQREQGILEKSPGEGEGYLQQLYKRWPAPIKQPIKFVTPLSDEIQRLVNQNGLFVKLPNGIYLENWVEENFPAEKDYILMKILIPNRDREDCLKTLNRMNINHLTLFPDLYGASKFCNLFGEIEKY